MATIRELSDKGPDGTRLGQSATDLVSFHGATPSDQRAVSTSVVFTVAITNAYGFATSSAVTDLLALVHEIKNLLQEKGLMAS